MKTFISKHLLMVICLLLIWIKTFLVSTLIFNINQSLIMGLIYSINPLLFLFILFSLGLFLKPTIQTKYLFIVTVVLTIILYSNVVYYREFIDVITLPMLLMGGNMGDLSTSIFALIKWYDIFYFADVILISFLLMRNYEWLTVTQVSYKYFKLAIFGVAILATISVTQFKSLDQSQSFNREQFIQTMGLYKFYIYDTVTQFSIQTRPSQAEENDWDRIIHYLEENRVEPNSDMFGIGKDMNVIVVVLESVESFVIGETLNGEEITPFLNELIEESFYFENFYYQTGQGKTSDSEFIINNSLHALDRGAVFLTHFDNEYRALPRTLKEYGYYTAVFHANDETFYNRDVMYPNLGYEQYYSFDDYEITADNSVGWGLKDIDFVEQSIPYLTELPEPFYSTMITLTNHFPYDLNEEDYLIQPFDSDSHIVNQYFPTVRYTDEAMKILVDQLKKEGLYDNTILVMYGDHYGIAPSHYGELGKFFGKELSLYDAIKLERVPLIVHIPGMEGKTISTISGQIDVMPTLLNILGIPEDDHVMFGNDLFAKNRDGFVVLRGGSVVTEELIYTNETCIKNETGHVLPLDYCDDIKERGSKALYFSDKIIYGDLLRFKND